MTESKVAGRLHIVLVPGFGGFDALGQIEYYAGTTTVFQAWREGSSASPRGVVLHYFDNLPTAGVRTRAGLLSRYLTKRVLRGEFQKNDEIALIGHSTGGLDIRQLLCDLDELDRQKLEVAGIEDHDPKQRDNRGRDGVSGGELLSMIKRVVFISVPQRGTNIANWVRAQPLARQVIVALVKAAVDALDVPVVEPASLIATRTMSWLRKTETATWIGAMAADLVIALADVNAEIGLRGSKKAAEAADGRAALADLNLWLSHTHADFLAIDDLSSTDRDPSLYGSVADVVGKLARPIVRSSASDDRSGCARADDAARSREKALWGERIRVRSYATVARNPFPKEARNQHQIRSVAGVLLRAVRPRPGSDITFQSAYAACAVGPFVDALRENTATCFFGKHKRVLGAFENDGIVNTASMLWPSAEHTYLIDADHGDIIGHYARKPAVNSRGRKFDAYDILQSSSGYGGKTFDESDFNAVWSDIFTFCAS